MLHTLAVAALLLAPPPQATPARPAFDSFEVATIKPVNPEPRSGRFIKMENDHRFIGKAYTLKLLIAYAYDLNPKAISGGPAWVDNDHFDILAVTPGEQRPTRDEQMRMLRALLTDRFKLTFHREPKDFSIYALERTHSNQAPSPNLRPTTTDAPTAIISTVYPDHVHLPARNASMADLAAVMQRAMLDRPVVDRTNLPGRFDFDLDFAPDESQFGGELPRAPDDAQAAPLFRALEDQLGLHLEATRGSISTLVVDRAQLPSVD